MPLISRVAILLRTVKSELTEYQIWSVVGADSPTDVYKVLQDLEDENEVTSRLVQVNRDESLRLYRAAWPPGLQVGVPTWSYTRVGDAESPPVG